MKTDPEKLRILFLEDIPSDVELAVRELRRNGIDFIYEATDDKAGFMSRINDFRPDIVISDYILPTINGLEAIGISLDNAPDVPVIILTGSMDEQTAVACMKAGATDYVVKDFMAKLPFAVREAIDKRNARSELERKTSELNNYFENARDLIYVYRFLPEPGFEYVSPSSTSITGYTPEEHYADPQLGSRLIHPEDAGILAQLISTKDFSRPLVLRWKRKDGRTIWTEQQNVPVYDKEGNLVALHGIARDITDLRSEQDKYRVLFESNPLPMWVYDLENLKFIAVNDAAIIRYGYTKEEFMNMTLRDIRPIEDIPVLIENIKTVSEEFQTSGAWRHKLKGGEIIYVEIASHSLEFDGRPCRMVMANDITRRVKDEAEIRKLNRTYSVLSNVNKSIVRITDKQQLLEEICRVVIEHGDFRLVWIGELAAGDDTIRIHASKGIYSGKMIGEGHPISSVIGSMAPCAKALTASSPIIKNNLSSTGRHCFVLDESPGNGIRSVACFPFSMPGGNHALICFYSSEDNFFDKTEVDLLDELTQDISFAIAAIENEKARKEAIEKLTKSEARYRKFFEEDLTADYISTVNGELVDCNNAYIRMFGFRDRDHAMMTPTVSLYAKPSEREKFLTQISEMKSIEGHEITYRTVDGRTIHAILNSFGHFGPDGQLVRIQGYIFDITDIKKAQDEMREARELAEKSNRLKDAFIANISHEIRTPMNAIIGFSGIIREALAESIDNETAGYFSVINEAGARLMRTVDMILSLSKIQAGIMESKPAEINIDQTIASIITEHQPTSAKKELPVSYINRSGVVTIETDRYSFGEIVSNLVDNAIKYTHKGKVEVIAERERGGELLVKVSDTGIGISSEFRERIFQPFVQEETGYSRSYEGVGLGLSIVKKFAEMAGFGIRLESEKGVGSTFTVVIPPSAIKTAPVADNSPSVNEPATEAMIRDKSEGIFPMVLAVEDDEDSKIYLEAILSRRFRLVTVSSADEVLPAMDEFLPDIVLMDISLRGSRNGLEITDELRNSSKYKSIPIIAVTAHAFPSDRLNALKSGCSDYITKPFSPGTLYKAIDKALGASD